MRLQLNLLPAMRVLQVIWETLPVNSGPGHARNTGIDIAWQLGADVVCCTDSDCLPAADWIMMMTHQQQACPGLVYGDTLSHAPETLTGVCAWPVFNTAFIWCHCSASALLHFGWQDIIAAVAPCQAKAEAKLIALENVYNARRHNRLAST